MALENVLLEPTLDTVKGILILDNDGKRILAKYYDAESFPNTAAQKKLMGIILTAEIKNFAPGHPRLSEADPGLAE